MTKLLLRNYPKIGHVWVELIACMSWRRRLCDHSCLPSRHHPIQTKRVGKIQGWSRLSQEWIKLINSQSVKDVPRGIKWSHGTVSIVHCTLCTNPWSMWEFYVGLGTCPWACVKRKISYNPWKGIKWWSSSKLLCASSSGASRRDQVLEACRPLWWQWTCEDVPKSGSPIVDYGGVII